MKKDEIELLSSMTEKDAKCIFILLSAYDEWKGLIEVFPKFEQAVRSLPDLELLFGINSMNRQFVVDAFYRIRKDASLKGVFCE